MKIYIACDSFLALRNVRNALVGTRLKEAGFQTAVFVDPNQLKGAVEANVPDIEIRPLKEFSFVKYHRLSKWIWWLNLCRRSSGDPRTFLSKFERHLGSRSIKKYAVYPLFLLGWVLGVLGLTRVLRKCALRELQCTQQYREYLDMFKDHKPVLVAGFSPEGYNEIPFMQAAFDIGLPTVIMIRSRDNLASKIMFLPNAHEYLVWSEHQRIYFYHLYGELRQYPVRVIGSPQFSRHRDDHFRLSREDFFRIIRLDPNRPLIVFCLENPIVVPHQTNMAIAIAEAFDEGRIEKYAQLLIRNHPRAFGSDYDPLGGRRYKDVSVYPKPTHVPFGNHDDNLIRLLLEDEPMHLATMSFQDVNLNIMSTSIIDSAIFDKPIINIAFDLPPETPKHRSVKRFFKRTDYRIIAQSNAVSMVYSLEELVAVINRYINNPKDKTRERAQLVEQDIGKPDNDSNEILLELFVHLAQKKPGVSNERD